MEACGKNLKESQQYPLDAIIGRLISLRRLDDQIYDSLYTEDSVDLPLNDPRILINYRFLQTQLDGWKQAESNRDFQLRNYPPCIRGH